MEYIQIYYLSLSNNIIRMTNKIPNTIQILFKTTLYNKDYTIQINCCNTQSKIYFKTYQYQHKIPMYIPYYLQNQLS